MTTTVINCINRGIHRPEDQTIKRICIFQCSIFLGWQLSITLLFIANNVAINDCWASSLHLFLHGTLQRICWVLSFEDQKYTRRHCCHEPRCFIFPWSTCCSPATLPLHIPLPLLAPLLKWLQTSLYFLTGIPLSNSGFVTHSFFGNYH